MSIARDIARMATPDQNFRERLIADPKAGIAKDFGNSLPENVTIHTHEDTANELHLVLDTPLELAASRPLSDREVQQVSGGLGIVFAVTGTNTDLL